MTKVLSPDSANTLGRWSENRFGVHLHLPPIEMKDGVSRLEFTVEDIHLRPGGIMHGGMLATVLDTVSGFAAYSAAPKNSDVVTMQLNLNMTAAARVNERVVATAQVVHAGRRTAVVTAEVRLDDGKLLATGSATMFFITEGVA